jgi:hypothetical protein
MGKTVSALFVFDIPTEADARADELLVSLARVFRQREREATFKLTGAYAQAMARRGCRDLIELLKRQDVGLYSEQPQGEPLPAALAACNWKEGVREFARRQTPGYQAVAFLAGRIPSCYGDEAWVPQAFGTLADWGTRVVLCRDSYLGDDGLPYFFGGRLNLSCLGPNWIDLDRSLPRPDGYDAAMVRCAERIAALRATGGVVCLRLFPSDLLAGGNGIEAVVGNIARLLDAVSAMPDVRVQSARQVVDRLADISYEHPIPMEFLQEMARVAARGHLRPFEYSAGFLSPSEQLYLITAAWDASHKKGKPVRNSTSRTPLGPAERVVTDPGVGGIHAAELPRLIHDLLETLTHRGQLPPSMRVRDGHLAIGDLLATLADGFHVGDLTPIDLPLRKAELANEDRVRLDRAQQCWRNAGLAADFHSPRQLELARLQLWTYKPVQLRDEG